MSTTTNNTATVLLGWLEPFRAWLDSLGAIGSIIWIVLLILAIMMPVIIAVAFYVVWERKLIGWMHIRHGPMYVGWGILQAFADVFKLLFKEVVKPTQAHPVLYVLAPLITAGLFVVVFVVALGRGRGEVMGLPFVEFIGPGILMMTVIQTGFANSSSSLISAKMQGNIIDTLMPPLSAGEILTAMDAAGLDKVVLISHQPESSNPGWPRISTREALDHTAAVAREAARTPRCPWTSCWRSTWAWRARPRRCARGSPPATPRRRRAVSRAAASW